MRREIGYDVFASDDPHEQAMPFPNMGNNPLIPILGSCRNWHQSGFPSGARQGTPSPWIAQTCPQPLPCALRAGNRLLHLLIANWDLAALLQRGRGRMPIRVRTTRAATSGTYCSLFVDRKSVV